MISALKRAECILQATISRAYATRRLMCASGIIQSSQSPLCICALIKSDLRVARLASLGCVVRIFSFYLEWPSVNVWVIRVYGTCRIHKTRFLPPSSFDPSNLQYFQIEEPHSRPCIYNPLSYVQAYFPLCLNYSAWYAILNFHLHCRHLNVFFFLFQLVTTRIILKSSIFHWHAGYGKFKAYAHSMLVC